MIGERHIFILYICPILNLNKNLMKTLVIFTLLLQAATPSTAQPAAVVNNAVSFNSDSNISVLSVPDTLEISEYDTIYDTNYYLYNSDKLNNYTDIIKYPLLTCRLIKQNKYALCGKRTAIAVGLNDSIEWKNNIKYLDYFFSYLQYKENIRDIKTIDISLPIDLSLFISLELEKHAKSIKRKKVKNPVIRRFDGMKYDRSKEIEFIKTNIKSSTFFKELNFILKRYDLAINDVLINEPMLLYTKKEFVRTFPKYKRHYLPNKITRIIACFILTPIVNVDIQVKERI